MPRPYVFVSPKDFKNGTTKDGVKKFDGTGPFKLGEHKKDESADFNKNDQYWGEKSKLNKVQAKVMPAGETAFLSIKKVKRTLPSQMIEVRIAKTKTL